MKSNGNLKRGACAIFPDYELPEPHSVGSYVWQRTGIPILTYFGQRSNRHAYGPSEDTVGVWVSATIPRILEDKQPVKSHRSMMQNMAISCPTGLPKVGSDNDI